MGVLKTKKKLPRRVKKTIRRTLSGLCMISAIIVALVPAKPSEGYTVIPDTQVSNYDYSYGVLSDGTDDLTLSLDGVDLGKYKPTSSLSDSDVYKTYYVRQSSGGEYEYGWQFMVYDQTIGGSSYGVICDYNSLYETDLLEINKYLPLGYLTITLDEYEDFYDSFTEAGDSQPETVTIDGYTYKNYYSISSISDSIITDSDEYYINKYFNQQYEAYKSSYNAWLTKYNNWVAYQAWEAAGSSGTAPNSQSTDPGAAPVLKVFVSAIPNADGTNLLKRQYFCEVNKKYNTSSVSIKGYTLVSVYDTTASVSSGSSESKIYLVQGTPNVSEDGGSGSSTESNNDALGFYVTGRRAIMAIGDQAFKGVQKVDQMKLSSDIAYIGDEAFISSFIKGIEFSNVKEVGNRAFKNCTKLSSIEFGDGTTLISTEAFYGCNVLTSVEFPYSIEQIGPGAFAECSSLATVDMSAITQANCELGGFAFYNDKALSTVTFSDYITKIGDACFALNEGATGSWSTITLPDNLSSFGDFMLAGRGNLTKLNMPKNYGRTQTPAATLPEHLVWNCYNLECMEFPVDGMGSCGYVDFSDESYIFASITNDDFYVKGPELNANKQTASPRTSTWGKTSGNTNDLSKGRQVPYVYVDSNGNTQYEVSDGTYILVIDSNGVLQSCQFAPGVTVSDIDMIIPETIGSTKVTGIASTCFDNETLRTHMKTLTIEDNTISSIAAGAFENYTNLEEVYIGDSVTSIGASAFKGCNKLTYVKFNTPSGGYSSFPLANLGEDAFSTGSNKLTFEGGIDENYGPFVWATDVDNYVDESKGTRVCYKSGYPYYLTVLVDNRNGLATLVDYPHYDQLDTLSNTSGSTTTVSDSNKGTITLDTTLTNRYENFSGGTKDVLDSGTGEIIYSYTYNESERKIIDAIFNVDIPSGIDSIDVKGFLNDTSPLGSGYSSTATNTSNRSLYCLGLDNAATYELKGLFNGYYGTDTGSNEKREYDDISGQQDPRETEFIGNDRITSVSMKTVQYLPDNAFNSCEQLTSINLGGSLTEMGDAPFAGCVNLTGISSSTDDFLCENGIVYSKNADDSYNIVEVLSSRGKKVGSQKIKVSDEDPKLAEVSSISDGAFENCDGITGVDFTGITELTEIPDKCFKDCDYLNQVVLPDNITSIGHNAFAGCMEGIELVCYGTEVYLPNDAFGTTTTTDDYDLVSSKRVISYKDSAVYKAAKDLGADVSEVLDNKVKVQFFDYDGTELSDIVYVTEGGSVPLEKIPDDPTRSGYTFNGWNKSLTNVTTDLVVVATYVANSSSTSGNDSGSSSGGSGSGSSGSTTSGNNTKFYTLTVTNGNGSGSYAEGATVIITCTNPPSGKVFDKWVPTTNDLGIASVNVAATTLKMPAHEASVTATFKTASPSGTSSSVSGNSSSSSSKNKSGNTIIISKSGISNTDLASAQVTGSSDNYVIRIAESAAATAAVEKALTNEYGSLDGIRYSAMDISLYDATGTNKITNYSGLSVTLTLPIPDVLTQYAGNNKAAGVVNEKLDKLSPKFTTIDGVPCITFTCTHFSPYTIYVDTGNLSANGVSDISPKTGDIQPKWFLVAGLAALSIALFFVKDKRTVTGRVA